MSSILSKTMSYAEGVVKRDLRNTKQVSVRTLLEIYSKADLEAMKMSNYKRRIANTVARLRAERIIFKMRDSIDKYDRSIAIIAYEGNSFTMRNLILGKRAATLSLPILTISLHAIARVIFRSSAMSVREAINEILTDLDALDVSIMANVSVDKESGKISLLHGCNSYIPTKNGIAMLNHKEGYDTLAITTWITYAQAGDNQVEISGNVWWTHYRRLAKQYSIREYYMGKSVDEFIKTGHGKELISTNPGIPPGVLYDATEPWGEWIHEYVGNDCADFDVDEIADKLTSCINDKIIEWKNEREIRAEITFS